MTRKSTLLLRDQFSSIRSFSLILAGLVLLLTPGFLHGQFDDKFYMPPIWQTGSNPQNSPSEVFISTPFNNVSVNVRTVDGTFNFNGVVSSNAPLTIPLTPAQGQTTVANTTIYNGLIVTATAPVQAAHRVVSNTSQSLLTMKGASAAGVDFRCGSPVRNGPSGNTQARHFISVMAIEDNTQITFQTPFTMQGVPNPHTITLNEGESYCIRSQAVNQHVAGARVTSTKPIIANSGSIYTPTPNSNGNNGADSALDQLLPVEFAGFEYAIVRGSNTGNLDYVMVVATEDNTQVFLDGGVTPLGTINAGQFLDITMTGTLGTPHYIRTDRNSFLFHVSGASADDEVDMAIIPAITCTGSRYLGLSKFQDNVTQRLQMIISDNADEDLVINGIPYTSYSGVIVNPIPGLSGWKAASIPGTSLPQNMSISSDDLFHAGWLVGSEVNGGYGYFSRFNTGFDFIDPVTGLPTPIYSLGSLCQGQSIDHCVNALSCGSDNEIVSYSGAEGTVVISPPSAPGETCFRYTAGFNEVGPDTVAFVFENELGYDDVLEIIFNIVNPNTPINGGADQQLCSGASSTTLSAVNPDPLAQGYWTVAQGTGVLANPNSPTTSVTNLSLGQNIFIWNQFYAACNVLRTDVVVVSRFSGTPPAANAGPDANLCSGTTYTMQANNPGGTAIGTWEILTGNATIFNINSPTALVTNIGIGVNTFRWTISNDPCPGTTTSDNMVINVYNQNHPAANAGPDQSVCQGTPTVVSLTGNTPIIPATGQWSVVSGTGTFANPNSTSTTVSGLSIGLNVFRWTINNGPCGILTDDVVVTVFDPNTPASNAGPDQAVCLPSNTAALAASASTFPATGAWSVTSGSGSFANVNDPATQVSGLSLGTNVLRWTVNNGPCPSGTTFDELTILVYPASQPTVSAGPDQQLCDTGSPVSTLLAGSSVIFPGTGQWTVVNGTGTFTNASSPTSGVSGLSAGVNTFRWTVSNGPCGMPQSDDVVITLFIDNTQAANAGPDASLCTPTTSYTMQATTPLFPATGIWTLVAGSGVISDSSSPTTDVTNLGIGLNTFRWTIQNGPCGASNFDEVTIAVYNANLPAANAGTDQEYCFSNAIPVVAPMAASAVQTPATGLWTLVSGGGTIIDPTSPTTNITNLPIGHNVFEWTVNNGPCGSTSDQITIVIYDPAQPAADAGPDQSICSTTSGVTLQANALFAPATGVWTVVNGTGIFSDPTSPLTDVSGLSLGINTFQWTIDNGPCTSPAVISDQVVVTVFNTAQAPANAGPDQEICSTIPQVNLSANTAFLPATGTWTLQSGSGIISNASSPNAVVTGLSIGLNTFRWTISNGPCGVPTFDEVTVTVYDQNNPPSNAGPDQAICLPLDQAFMAGSVPTFPASGDWALVSGTGTIANTKDPFTLISGLSIGANVFSWTVSNGACNTVTSDNITVFVFDEDQELPDAGPDASLCTPQSTYTMQANSVTFPATGTWSLVSGSGTIANASNPSTGISGLTVGANVFRWTIDNGPCPDGFNTDDVTIFVFDQNQPVANAGPDQELCHGGAIPTSTTLAGSSLVFPGSGQWSLVSGSGTIVNASSPNSQVTDLAVGVNVFRWTVNNGPCGTTSDLVSIIVFSPDQTSAEAGQNQAICSTTPSVTLQANALIGPATGTWTVVNGSGVFSSPNSPVTDVTGLSLGTNVFRWTIYNGPCATPVTLFDQVAVVVYNVSQAPANAGPDQSICSTTPSVALAANTVVLPATGSWTLVAGTGTFSNASSPATTVTGLSVGLNTFRWTISNGPCGVPTTDDVTIVVFDQNAAVANAGNDLSICLPQTSVSLSGNTPTFPATGTWALVSGSGAVADAGNPTSSVSGLTVGANTFSWTINNGACGTVTSDNIVVNVFDLNQELPDAGPDAFLCTPQSTYTMQGNTITFPAQGTWSLVSGTGTISNVNDPAATISGLGIGANTFRWTIDNGPCPDGINNDEVTIYVFDQNQPAANAGPDQELCFEGVTPAATAFAGSSLTFPATGVWTLVSGSGTIVNPASPTSQVTGLGVGLNVFRWTVNNGPCAPSTTVDEMSIFVYPASQPAANAGPDQELCSTLNQTTLAANTPVYPGSGQWTIVQGTGVFADAANPNTSVSGLGLGTNILRWTIDNGPCLPNTTSDLVTITVFDNNQLPANAGADFSICSTSPFVTLTGNAFSAPATASWSLVSGTGTIISSANQSTLVLDLSVGLNVFEYTIFNGPCAAQTTDQITVTVFDEDQPAANAGPDQSICLPQTSVTIAGNAPTFPATGIWTLVQGSGVIASPTAFSTSVSGLAVGLNVFRWTISNGPCLPGSSFDEVSIFVFDNTQPSANAGPDQSFCEPISSAFLSGNTPIFPASGTWVLVSGTGVIADPSNPASQVTGLTVGENIFRWTISNGPCAGSVTSDEVSIFIFDDSQLPADAGADQWFCSPAPVATVTGNLPTFPASGTWELVSGTGVIADPASPVTQISGLSIGENIFRWTITNGPCLNSVTSDLVSLFVYDTDAPAADAGADQSICAPLSEVTMAANSAVFPAAGTWELVSGSGFVQDPNDPASLITNLAVGENIFRWTIDNGGCGSDVTTDLVTINVYSEFSPDAFAGMDQDLCSPTNSTMLTGNFPIFPAYGEWSLVSGTGTLADPADPNSIVSGLDLGPNVFQWTIFNGPCANAVTTDQVVITVFNGAAEPPFAGNDQEQCSPDFTSTLAADPVEFPGTGTWTVIGGTGTFADPNSPTSAVSDLSIGFNVFRWTADYSVCGTPFDDVNIIVYDSSQDPADAGPDQELCNTVPDTQMQANAALAPGYGAWSVIQGSGAIDSPNDPNTLVSNLAVGENLLVWEFYTGGCLAPELSRDTVAIYVFDDTEAPAFAGDDQFFCTPTSVSTLVGGAIIYPAFPTWELIQGTGVIADPNNITSIVTGLTVGENIFRLSIDNGPCANGSTSDNISIFIYDENQAPADAGPDQQWCRPVSDAVLAGNALTFPATGTWILLSGTGVIADPSDPQSAVSGLSVGENVFQWTIDNGPCAAPTSDVVSIFIFDDLNENALAGPDQEMCLPQNSTTLAGNGVIFPASGQWTLIQGTGTIVNPSSPQSAVTDLGVGENLFVWTVLNGPCSNASTADTVAIRVYDPGAPVADAGVDQFFCTPTSTTVMNAAIPADPGYGTWSVVSGSAVIADVNDPATAISGLSVGETILQWTVYNGPCAITNTTDLVSIFIYDETQPAADAGSDQDLCTPQYSTQLSANSVIFPATGTWVLVSGSGDIADPSDPTTLVDNLGIGPNVFRWTIDNGPCDPASTSDEVVINLFDADQAPADAGADQEICLPQVSVTLNGSAFTGSSTGEWTVFSGSGIFADATASQTNVDGLSVGINELVWTVFNGPCGFSSDTLTVFVFDPDAQEADAGSDVSYCTPVSTHTFSANTPDTPGVGTWALVSGTGSINDVHDPNAEVVGLTIGENVFSWTIYNGPCEAPTTDLVSVFIYDENQPDANAGPDQEMCLPQNSTTLAGNDVIFPANGQWTLIQGTGTIVNPSSPQSAVTDLGVGENLFVWTILNGPCSNAETADTVAIRVYDPGAPVADAGVDQFFCTPTSTTTMTAAIPADPGYGTWSVVSGSAVIADVNDPATAISGLSVGETVLQWTVYNGPCAITNTTDLVSIFIYDETQPAADAGADQDLCTPQYSTQLSANSVIFPATGTWVLVSGSGDIADTSDPQTMVDNLGIGPNVFRWTIDNGPCDPSSTSDEVVINLFDADQAPADAGADQEICLPQVSVTLSGSAFTGSSTGEWTVFSGSGIFADATASQTNVDGLSVGINELVWTVFNGPCGFSSDTLTVFVFDPDAQEADAGSDVSYCTPVSTHTFSANTPDTPGVGTWALVSGTGSINDVNDPNAEAVGLTIGENVFSWTIYNGPCEAPTTDLVSVFIYDENQPAAEAGPGQEICEPQSAVTMAGNAPVFPAFGTWTLVQGTGTITDPQNPATTVTDLSNGINVFEWTISNGPCDNPITSDQVAIVRYPESPDPPYAGEDQQLCTPVTSTLMTAGQPSVPGIGTWSVISGTGNFADPNDPTTEVTGLSVGENVFSWTVYNGPCPITNLSDMVSIFLYDNGQNDADAGPDQQWCTPVASAQLAGNAPIFPAYGEWSVLSGSVTIADINDPNTLITNMAPGVNVLQWTVYNGPCPGSVTTDEVSISIFIDTLQPADAGPDQELCLPVTSTSLTGSALAGAATGQWTVVSGGGVFADASSPNTTVSGLPQGINVFSWTVNNGPCGTTSDNMTVSVFNPDAPVAEAGPTVSYCTPVSTHTMAANTPEFPGVGSWTLITGTGIIEEPNSPSSLITGLQVGENIFMWSIDNGPCAPPTVDVVSIFIYNETTPDANAGVDQEICLPINTVQMSASAAEFPAIGTWSVVQGQGVIADVNDPNTSISGLTLGSNIFSWTVDNGPCENGITTDVVMIRVFDPDLPAPTAGPDQDICTPESEVVMNGSVPDDPNYGFWTLDSGSGVIVDELSPTTAITGLAAGVSCFTWNIYNGVCANSILSDQVCINVFNQNQSAALAGPDQELCFPAVTTVMAGNVPASPAIGTWAIFGGDGDIQNANDPATTIANMPIGTNTFTWTIDNGPCPGAVTSDQVNVLIFDPNAAPADAGEDIEVCTPQDCVVLSAVPGSDPQTGTWTVIEAVNGQGPVAFGTIDNVNDPSAEICALVVGVHTLQWELYNGPCDNNTLDTLTISVFDLNAPPADAGEDQELCGDNSATGLEANAPVFPAVGTWTVISSPGQPVIGDIHDPNTMVTGLDIGVTVLQWHIYNGPCNEPTTDTVIITVFDPESPDASAGADQFFCENFPATVMAGNTPIAPAFGTWTIISGGGVIADPNDPNTAVTDIPLNENIYVWTVYNGACANSLTSDTVSIYVNDLTVAAANAGDDQEFCGSPQTIQLDGSVTVGLATSLWTVVQGGGTFSDAENNNPFLTNIPLGVNIYEYTVDNGECGITTDQVTITVYDPDLQEADAGNGAVICEHEFTTFSLMASEANEPAIGSWNVISGPIELSDMSNAGATVLTLGQIATELVNVESVISWTVNNGVCGTTVDTIAFILKDCLTIEIADAFSPNGDGVNDEWVIPNIDTYPRNSLKIFNRWGTEVYSAAPYSNNNPWDGTSSHPATLGDQLPVSTYYYILDLGTGEEAFHGFVYLKR
jgi:gliding motility-associated-like protein